jgi:hypothetical protein
LDPLKIFDYYSFSGKLNSMEKIMTRWNLLQEITMAKETREAIGNTWPSE